MHTLSALTGESCASPSPPTRQDPRTVCQKHTEYYSRTFAPQARDRGAARGARGRALPFRLSMPSQTGRARVFPNRHVEILPPDLWRPPLLPRVMKRLNILFRTGSCGHTAGKRVNGHGKRVHTPRRYPTNTLPTPSIRARHSTYPTFFRRNLRDYRTYAPSAGDKRHTTPRAPEFHSGQSSAVS